MSDLLILFLFLGPLLEAGSVGSGMLDNGADRGGGGAAWDGEFSDTLDVTGGVLGDVVLPTVVSLFCLRAGHIQQ